MVLNATIFLTSFSQIAKALEKNIVSSPNPKKNLLKSKQLTKNLNPKIKNKPAVTKVLLCTKELTGVGALIALGNQPEKGN